MNNNHPENNHGTSQACAACKYQRRKCAPDCILAPYFPHHKQRQFLNAHKLFGVSNITKIIKPLTQSAKDDAMSTIIFQSDVRASDPVGGCYRIILDLQRQIEYSKAELDVILHQLMICRAQAQDQARTGESIVGSGDPVGAYWSIEYHYGQEQGQQNQPFVAVRSDSSNLVQDFNGWGLQDCVSSSPCGDHGNDHHLGFDAQEIIDTSGAEGVLRAESGLFREDADSIQKAQDQHLQCTFTLTNCNS